MLVDLARNDVGRVVEFGTCQVDELMTLERYSHVMHLTSQVSGRLAEGRTPHRRVAGHAARPAPSRARRRSGRWRSSTSSSRPSRGPYAGVVGYLDFSGNIDTAIAIRTMIVEPRRSRRSTPASVRPVRGSSPTRCRRRGARDPQQGQGVAERRTQDDRPPTGDPRHGRRRRGRSGDLQCLRLRRNRNRPGRRSRLGGVGLGGKGPHRR
jgi:hypothetical protein